MRATQTDVLMLLHSTHVVTLGGEETKKKGANSVESSGAEFILQQVKTRALVVFLNAFRVGLTRSGSG